MATIRVSGMRCGHCVSAVSKALGEIDGITDVQVNLEKGEASYSETSPVNIELIKTAITKVGFEVL